MVERKGRENLNKEVEWRLYGGARGGSLNKEAKWKPLFGGAEGGASFIEEGKWKPLCMVERCRMETFIWWRARGGKI